MKKLSVKQKNWLLSVHIAIAGIWFGTALIMVVIGLSNRNTTSGDALYAINAILKQLDDFVIIPAAMGSLLTGALLCWLTIWGFVKHYWVITKWVGTIALILFGTFWLGPWTNAATSISEVERLQALSNPLYMFDVKGMIIGGAVTTLSLLTIIAISTLKPWGRRNTAKENNVAKKITLTD